MTLDLYVIKSMSLLDTVTGFFELKCRHFLIIQHLKNKHFKAKGL